MDIPSAAEYQQPEKRKRSAETDDSVKTNPKIIRLEEKIAELLSEIKVLKSARISSVRKRRRVNSRDEEEDFEEPIYKRTKIEMHTIQRQCITDIVIEGWIIPEWQGRMQEIKSMVEEAWGISLPKPPVWCSEDRDSEETSRAITFFVARHSDRFRILTSTPFSYYDKKGIKTVKQHKLFAKYWSELRV